MFTKTIVGIKCSLTQCSHTKREEDERRRTTRTPHLQSRLTPGWTKRFLQRSITRGKHEDVQDEEQSSTSLHLMKKKKSTAIF
jgi:hypothetical protein